MSTFTYTLVIWCFSKSSGSESTIIEMLSYLPDFECFVCQSLILSPLSPLFPPCQKKKKKEERKLNLGLVSVFLSWRKLFGSILKLPFNREMDTGGVTNKWNSWELCKSLHDTLWSEDFQMMIGKIHYELSVPDPLSTQISFPSILCGVTRHDISSSHSWCLQEFMMSIREELFIITCSLIVLSSIEFYFKLENRRARCSLPSAVSFEPLSCLLLYRRELISKIIKKKNPNPKTLGCWGTMR